MKLVTTVLISAALLAAADPQAKKTKTVPTAEAATAPAPIKRVEVPQGAVEREPGRFFYTDSAGKKWIYVRTPFGASRMEDKGDALSAPVKPVDAFANIKMTEAGDTVTFERQGSFGVSKWQKKKSELTEEERAALRQRQQAPNAQAAQVGEGSAKQDR